MKIETMGIDGSVLLAVVADPVRWRLLDHLAAGGETCVCELQPIAQVAGNLLSYHLKGLRDAGLVTTDKRGRWVYYTIAPDTLDRLAAALPGAAGRQPETSHPSGRCAVFPVDAPAGSR
jgi:ArsR family transcriptional regulator